MKNIFKIGLFPIMTALIVLTMSLFMIGTSAEETETVVTPPLDIAYCNLSFENEVHLMYAIKSADEKVKLLVWNAPQDDYSYGTQNATLSPLSEKRTINGESYTAFKYTGLTAKQMTDYIYVRAYIPATGEKEEEYGTTYKYSILEYAYYLLGKTGTATTNEKLIKMLNEMLDYGAATQEYFEYKTDTLATDYFVQIKLTNGTLPDGFNKGLYKVGSTVTITAPEIDADGAGFVEWVDENGNTVADTAAAEITVGESNTTITAHYYSIGLEFTLNSDNTSYSVSGIGTETETERIYIPPTHKDLAVTAVGNSAFSSTKSFNYVNIPDSITNLDYYAFNNCTELKSVEISNSITNIGGGAFSGCKGLTSIAIPNSVKSIGSSAFSSSGLLAVHINDISAWCNIKFSSYDSNPLYFADYLYLNDSLITELVIPEGVKKIPNYAFQNQSSITSVTIPSTVTSIGQSAFFDCTGLKSVNINDIAAWCNIDFYNVNSNPLFYAKNLYLNDSFITELAIPEGVTKIPQYAFFYQSSITNVTIPSTVKNIGMCAFSNCTALANVNIPNGITSIGNSTFSNCNSLTSISIPNSITYIGMYAFSNCSKLQKVCISDISSWCNISFWDATSNPLYYAKSLYLNDELVTNIVIPDSIQKINSYAFYHCTSLNDIIIPNSVISIGAQAFSNCTNLTSITLSNNLSSIGSSAFHSCQNIESITIPASVTSIESYAFYGCTKLREVHTSDMFAWCNIYFGGNNANPTYYGKLYLNGTLVTDIVIPESITKINPYAFYNCSNLSSITIPDSVTSIGSSAFDGCKGLTSITIPDSVTNIYNYAFQNCTELTSVTIGNGVTSIGKNAFYRCTNLTNVTFENQSNWFVSTSSTATSGTAIDVTDSTTNATNFKSTYYEYCWKRSE